MCRMSKILLAIGLALATAATYQTGPVWTVVLTMAALGTWGLGTYHYGQHHGADLVRAEMAALIADKIKEATEMRKLSHDELRDHINGVTGRSSKN